MSALAADDGTHSFLAFLSAAQKEDGEKQAPEPTATKQLNAEANLLAQLTNNDHIVASSKPAKPPATGVGAAGHEQTLDWSITPPPPCKACRTYTVCG